MDGGQGLLAAIKAGVDVQVGVVVVGGAQVGAVVVGSKARVALGMALAAQDADEGRLELAAIAWVNDGVEAAVEVAQPEDHFEEGLRRTQAGVERACRGNKTKEMKKGFYYFLFISRSGFSLSSFYCSNKTLDKKPLSGPTVY